MYPRKVSYKCYSCAHEGDLCTHCVRCSNGSEYVSKGVKREYGFGNSMEIKNVIFNGLATIVLWADGTKTVVKVQNDEKFDPEKGLAMAIAKKALGNNGSYYNQIKKWANTKEV